MDLSRLYGVQYVRMARGAADTLVPYLDVPLHEGDELAVTLDVWPQSIRAEPQRAQDGRLIAGDPVLLRASDEGLVFDSGDGHEALVLWAEVKDIQVLGSIVSRSA